MLRTGENQLSHLPTTTPASRSSRRPPSRARRRRSPAVVLAAALSLVLSLAAAACGGDELGASLDLADLSRCPDPLVIQTDWFPEPEHGALYNLTGGAGRVDPSTGRFRGPLAADPTLTVEIRAGGPFLGERSALEVMADDADILLGYVDTDEAIASYDRHPTTAVVAPLDIDPQIIMWDPDTYTIESWNDVAETGATINHYAGASYPEFLVGTELVDEEQLDPGYDGSPDRFVASDGEILQQGFATQEPYLYERVLVDWGRPVDYLMIHDAGYELYQGTLAILDDRLDGGARACLAAFVPLVQQSIVDFQHDPTATNDVILAAVAELATSWQLTPDAAANTVVEMGSLGIVGNGGNRTIGDFDIDRVQGIIDVTTERLTSVDVPEGLRADDLVTNEFIDPDIGL